jgi:transcriptional regulator with XRE-family HTH domain
MAIMKVALTRKDRTALVLIGSRLAAARIAQNLTQAALASQTGLSKRTIERLETGAVATQLSGFLRVCQALSLPGPLELLSAEESPPPKRARRTRPPAIAPEAPAWDGSPVHVSLEWD